MRSDHEFIDEFCEENPEVLQVAALHDTHMAKHGEPNHGISQVYLDALLEALPFSAEAREFFLSRLDDCEDSAAKWAFVRRSLEGVLKCYFRRAYEVGYAEGRLQSSASR